MSTPFRRYRTTEGELLEARNGCDMKNFIPFRFVRNSVSILLLLLSTSVVANEEVVSSFKALVNAHINSYESDDRLGIYQWPNKEWGRGRYAVNKESVRYDVKTTDSLVSPYKGILEFTVVKSTSKKSGKTKEDVEGDWPIDNTFEVEHRHSYLYSEGEWRVSERKCKWFDWQKRWVACSVAEGCHEKTLTPENPGL